MNLEINAVDSLEMPPEARVPGKTTLSEDAASLSLSAAMLNAQAQPHSVFAAPTISFGFEHGDPDQPGLCRPSASGFRCRFSTDVVAKFSSPRRRGPKRKRSWRWRRSRRAI